MNTLIVNNATPQQVVGQITVPGFVEDLTPGGFVSGVYAAVLSISGIVLFVMLVYGAFKYMTAGEDMKAVEAARSIMTHAIIGMVLVIAAWFITRILEEFFGIKIFSGFSI